MSVPSYMVSPGYEYTLYYAYNELPSWLLEVSDLRVREMAKTLWLDGWQGNIPQLLAAAHKLCA